MPVLRRVSHPWLGLLPALLLVGAGCSSSSILVEGGSKACADGVDNDRDNRIDCADPDCRAVSFCTSSDGAAERLDANSGPDAGGKDAGLKDASARDQAPRDQARDGKFDSWYGRRCQYSYTGAMSLPPCPDKVTLCAYAPEGSGSKGVCSNTCASMGFACAGPSGYSGHCDQVQSKLVCIIHCSDAGLCPFDTQCYQQRCY